MAAGNIGTGGFLDEVAVNMLVEDVDAPHVVVRVDSALGSMTAHGPYGSYLAAVSAAAADLAEWEHESPTPTVLPVRCFPPRLCS